MIGNQRRDFRRSRHFSLPVTSEELLTAEAAENCYPRTLRKNFAAELVTLELYG
jgi:hypothetical protein